MSYYNVAYKDMLSCGPQYAAGWDYQKHVELKVSSQYFPKKKNIQLTMRP